MFYVLFYLFHVFLHDSRQCVVRGRTSAELWSKGEYLIVGERQVTLTTLLPSFNQEYYKLIGTWRTTQENSATTVHMALA
jgi:hypothetical protein